MLSAGRQTAARIVTGTLSKYRPFVIANVEGVMPSFGISLVSIGQAVEKTIELPAI